MKSVGMALAACAALAVSACAARLAPLPPAAAKHPEFVFPAVPPELQRTPAAERFERGWRFLQNDDLSNASLEFRAALARQPGFGPARTGQGYVALASRDYEQALGGFDAVLRDSAGYTSALVGRGQTLLALKREEEALDAFERALEADPSLSDLRRRVEVLRFRNLEATIGAAGAASAAGRLDEARTAYLRALEASPESAFLHRELGSVERRRGQPGAALDHFRQAVELDGSDVVSLTALAELLELQRDFAGAEAAYRRAAAVEPSPALTRRIAAAATRAREASLPPEFHRALESVEMTRAELAALIGVRLDAELQAAPPVQVVMTDILGHWAAAWMTRVAAAGVLPPFENHTFQPDARLQRVGLAAAVTRVLALMAETRPALRAHLGARPAIADMGPDHLGYPAAAAAVAAGVLPLLAENRFQPARPLSGSEAAEAIDRLKALAAAR